MSAFRAVALIDDILSTPELLAGFATSFSGREDAELIVHAPQFSGAEDALEIGLRPLADALGLDAEDAARVVVLTDPDAVDELAGTADALYAPAPRAGFDMLPIAADAHTLLALASASDPLPLDARAKRIVAYYDDVIADPRLIDDADVLADDETTLVVYAPDVDPEAATERLAALLEGIDLDVLLLAVPGSPEIERRLVDSASVVLTPLDGNRSGQDIAAVVGDDDVVLDPNAAEAA